MTKDKEETKLTEEEKIALVQKGEYRQRFFLNFCPGKGVPTRPIFNEDDAKREAERIALKEASSVYVMEVRHLVKLKTHTDYIY